MNHDVFISGVHHYSPNQNSFDGEECELTNIDTDMTFHQQKEFHHVLINILSKDLPPGSILDPEEGSTLIGIYSAIYHDNFQTNLFFDQLRYCPNEAITESVLDMIISWEIRRAGHTSKKEAIDCVMRNVSEDIELKNWILERLDRGTLYKFKQFVFSVVPEKFFWTGRMLGAVYGTLLFYWDVMKDAVTYLLFNHISSKIMVSKLKLVYFLFITSGSQIISFPCF